MPLPVLLFRVICLLLSIFLLPQGTRTRSSASLGSERELERGILPGAYAPLRSRKIVGLDHAEQGEEPNTLCRKWLSCDDTTDTQIAQSNHCAPNRASTDWEHQEALTPFQALKSMTDCKRIEIHQASGWPAMRQTDGISGHRTCVSVNIPATKQSMTGGRRWISLSCC